MSVSVRAMHGAAPIPEEERPRGWRERLARRLREMHDLVDDELRDPEAGHRHECAEQAQDDHRPGVPAMRLPNEVKEGGEIAQRGESLPPSSGALLLRNWRRAMHRSNGDRHADKLIRVAVESSSRLRGNAQTRGAHEPR